MELIASLLSAEAADTLIASFIHDLERLAGLLDSGVTDAVYAEVVGHGEVWSASDGSGAQPAGTGSGMA